MAVKLQPHPRTKQPVTVRPGCSTRTTCQGPWRSGLGNWQNYVLDGFAECSV